ncbi:condensation domain-containing protein [Streptomyces sp. NBC_01591]|uniref:condensation domain-containing protein n=1 Tax=Streptomyces sp. NBC_01591 TaxID=2975888 RepID=UPI002DDA7D02|nr:condensation domain-containing protein [Streptomyces sp. NBC_01591]WSD71853.1 condensation domain-containing protein [Streptomyces sp. NBC_01591]
MAEQQVTEHLTGPYDEPAAAALVPLAPTQRRMWVSEQLRPGRTEYNVVDLWAIDGPLDMTALEAAVSDVLQRHEALRTTFHLIDGEPMQRIHAVSAVGLEVIPGALDETATRERAESIARTPFDLASAPLVRWTVLRNGANTHLLQLVAHHLVVDGWSLEILLSDLSSFYDARLRGAVPTLPAVPTPYRTYASRRVDPMVLEAQTTFWKQLLRDLPQPPTLPPADRGAPTGAVRESLPVDTELVRRIKELARTERVTASAVWLACFAVVLGRWGGTRDVVMGTPLSGRTGADLLQTVGFFISTAVLRLRIPEADSGRDLLKRAHDMLIGAQLHQDVPFEDVVAAVRPARDEDPAAPFSAWFNVLSYPTHSLRLGTATARRLPAPVPGVPFGLSLYVDQRDEDAVRLDLVHDTAFLEGPYARALLAQMLAVARTFADDVSVHVDALDLDEGRQRAVEGPASVPVRDGVLDRIRRHPPAHPAVTDHEGAWTYAELLSASDTVARRLREVGLEPGDLVEITEAPGRHLTSAVLGVWESGGVFLVMDPNHPAPWRARLRDRAQPRFALRHTGDGVVVEELRPGARAPHHRVGGGASPAKGRPLYLLPTSGTTRQPRLVLGAERPLLAYLEWWSARYRIGPRDRFCALSGPSHDPHLRDMLLPLWNGGTLTVPPPGHRIDPGRAAQWLAAHRTSVVHSTPMVGRLIAQAARRGGVVLDHVRLVCFGGDLLTDETVDAWRAVAPAARIVSVYGTTETPQAASCHDLPPGEPGRDRRESSLGHGAVEARLDVVTAGGILAACGELGEIVVRSPLLTMGYLDDEAATALVYASDHGDGSGRTVFRTGDIGRRLADGSVAFVGRAATLVKSRGHRVSTAHLVAELRALPGVADAAVVLPYGGTAGPRLVAYVVPEDDSPLDPQDVLRQLATILPSGYLPDDVCLLTSLPLTPNGKLDSGRLTDLAARPDLTGTGSGSGRTAAPVTPMPSAEPRRGVLQRTVESVWQEVLSRPSVGMDDNFFDLGGTSSMAVRLRIRLEEELGRQLPPLLVFQSSTVRRMTDHLSGAPAGPGERPFALPARHVSARELRRAARAAIHSEGDNR